jgi:hypothetical protein
VVANSMIVPAAAVGLFLWFHANPMIAVGLLVAAVCPVHPMGHLSPRWPKGNVAVSVGLIRHSRCRFHNRLRIVSDDCDRVGCFGVGQTHANRD